MTPRTPVPGAPDGATQPIAKPRRKRRWLRWMMLGGATLLVLLIALVVFAPTIASSQPVAGYALGIANDLLRGEIAVDAIQLSWTGQNEVRGLRVNDPQQREVLRVERIVSPRGLWQLIWSGQDFGEVRVEAPVVQLVMNEQFGVTLADAFAFKQPSAPAAPRADSKLPEPRGRILIENGSLQIQRGGASYAVDKLGVDLDLQTLGQVQGRIAAELDGASTLTMDVSVSDLVRDGKLNLEKAGGSVKLATDRPVALARLAALVDPNLNINGSAQLSVDAEVSPGQIVARTATTLRGVRSSLAPQAQPLDVDLTSSATLTERRLTAKADVRGAAGNVDASLEYDTSAALPQVSAEQVMDALLKGAQLNLPEFRLEARGNVDLAAIEQAVPGLLKLSDTQRVTGGSVQVERLVASGGAAPTAAGSITLRDVGVAVGEQMVRPAPIALTFDGGVKPGDGAYLTSAELKSGFAQATVSGQPSDLRADLRVNLGQAHAELGPLAALGDIRPEGDLTAEFTLKQQQLAGAATLRSAAGTADARLDYDLGAALPALTGEALLSAVLTGAPLNLPPLALDASADVDLAGLQRIAPGLLRIAEGQEITAGRLTVRGLQARGGATPSAVGEMEISGVTVRSAERTLQPAPMKLAFDAALQSGKGIEVRAAQLTAAFAALQASGDPRELSATFEGDLTKLQAELGQIVDLGGMQMAGRLRGDLKLSRASDERFDLTANVQAESLRTESGGQRLELPRASLRQVGSITLADNAPTRIDAAQTQLDLNGEVLLDASGHYDLKSAGFAADVQLKRADLAFLGTRAGGVGGSELARYSGVLALTGSARRVAGDQPIESSGSLQTQGLLVDGQPLSERDMRLDWTAAQIAPDFATVRLQQAQLDSAPAALRATNIQFASAESLSLDLQVDGNADLAKLMAVIARVARMEPPAVAGQLTLASKAATRDGNVDLQGQASVAGLVVGAGAQQVRQDAVKLDFSTQLDQRSNRLTLSQMRLGSTPLTAELSGAVDALTTSPVLNLTGRYDADWAPLTALMHEFVPATVGVVTLQGRSGGALRANGPLQTPGARPEFRGLSADTTAGWDSANVYGIGVGGARLSPALADGRLTIPLAEMEAAGGKLRLGGVVDFTAADLTYSLAGRQALIENVPLNRAISEVLLSRINPIFLSLSDIQGRMSLVTQDLVLPLGESIKTRGAGRGRLDMQQVLIRPGGFMAELLALSSLSQQQELYTVEVSGCDFAVESGRIVYRDFSLKFPYQFDLIFFGSVGLDDSVDLRVSMPVSAALLERCGVAGPVLAYAKALEGARVEVPIVGTRQKPKLDFARVDVKPLIEKVLEKEAGAKIQDILGGVLGGEQGSKPGVKPGEQDKDKDKRPKLPRLPIPKPKKDKP